MLECLKPQRKKQNWLVLLFILHWFLIGLFVVLFVPVYQFPEKEKKKSLRYIYSRFFDGTAKEGTIQRWFLFEDENDQKESS